MKTIQSYKLKIKGKQVLQLPASVKFLSVTEGPTLNMLIDTEEVKAERHIEIFAAGAPMADDSSLYNYIGSSDDLHIFEKVKEIVEYELHMGSADHAADSLAHALKQGNLPSFDQGGRTSTVEGDVCNLPSFDINKALDLEAEYGKFDALQEKLDALNRKNKEQKALEK